MNNFYSGFIMKFRREEIKSDFYVALKVQLEIFSFSFLSFFFFQISSNIFLSAKTCVHGPGIFFFFIGMLGVCLGSCTM